MSEASEYQRIRKYWKDRYRDAQRKQSIHMWEAEHKERHPSIQSFYTERGLKVMSAVDKPEYAIRQAHDHQLKASSYAYLLNRFKYVDPKEAGRRHLRRLHKIIELGHRWDDTTVSLIESIAVREVSRKKFPSIIKWVKKWFR